MQHAQDTIGPYHARSDSTSNSIPSDPSPITPHSLLDQFTLNSASTDHSVEMFTYPSYQNGQGFNGDNGDFDGGLRLGALHMGYYVEDDHPMNGDMMKSGGTTH